MLIPYKCNIFCMKGVKYNDYLVSTMDTNGLFL